MRPKFLAARLRICAEYFVLSFLNKFCLCANIFFSPSPSPARLLSQLFALTWSHFLSIIPTLNLHTCHTPCIRMTRETLCASSWSTYSGLRNSKQWGKVFLKTPLAVSGIPTNQMLRDFKYVIIMTYVTFTCMRTWHFSSAPQEFTWPKVHL